MKILNDETGHANNKHISSNHSYENRKYRVVLTRKLDTGDLKDYALKLNGVNYFGVAITDNSAANHIGRSLVKLTFLPKQNPDTSKPVPIVSPPVAPPVVSPPALDITPPKVTGTDPGNKGNNVLRNKAVAISFSEDIQWVNKDSYKKVILAKGKVGKKKINRKQDSAGNVFNERYIFSFKTGRR